MSQLRTYIVFLGVVFCLLGCDPLASEPTRQVIIITAVPSATPPPTITPAITRTPIPTLTPVITPSATPFPCDEETGEIIKVDKFPSTVADENLRYRVYVPPCYQKSQARYPVVYLLHGSAETEALWEKLGMIEAADQGFRLGLLPPMILVMPYTGVIGNDNTFPPDPSYETVLLEELLPAIERDFCTWNERDHRAIAGISRGGFWAFSIALRHPDVFGIVAGHSAFMTQDLSLIPAAFNPLELALNSSFLPSANLRMYLDNGASDESGNNLELFSSRLTSRGISHTYVINPVGDHDNQYWAAHVSEYLAFYGRNWPRNASQLPSCLEPSP
jgi:enterochelin esterase-like enzyme